MNPLRYLDVHRGDNFFQIALKLNVPGSYLYNVRRLVEPTWTSRSMGYSGAALLELPKLGLLCVFLGWHNL